MSENAAEIATGAGVLAIAAGFLIYLGQVGGVGFAPAGNDTYTASFRSAEGIGVGTDVRLAGVKVGTVLDMKLDPGTFRANTVLSVQNDVALPDDTAISLSAMSSDSPSTYANDRFRLPGYRCSPSPLKRKG